MLPYDLKSLDLEDILVGRDGRRDEEEYTEDCSSSVRSISRLDSIRDGEINIVGGFLPRWIDVV